VDTVIHDHAYSLTLPGTWRREATKPGGPVVYRTPAGTEQVTISLLWSSAEEDSAAQLETLRAVVEKHRQSVLRAYEPEPVTLSDANIVERPSGPWASYFVFEGSTSPTAYVRINASAWTVGTLLYEQKGLTPELAKSRGLKILGSFALTGAPPAKP